MEAITSILHMLSAGHSFSDTLKGALGGVLQLGPLAGKLATWFSGSISGNLH